MSATPLKAEQIDAADRLYRGVEAWRRTDEALAALQESIPGFDGPATLLKTVAVNAMYGTNIYAIARVARHVEEVLALSDLPTAGPELVEAMAEVPPAPGGKPRRHRSFASKFAHFFIDPDRFPILDLFAVNMVRTHLGRAAAELPEQSTYSKFAAAFGRLAGRAGLRTDTRRLDRYLWIVGQYRQWVRNPGSVINSELRAMFEADKPDLALAAGPFYAGRSIAEIRQP